MNLHSSKRLDLSFNAYLGQIRCFLPEVTDVPLEIWRKSNAVVVKCTGLSGDGPAEVQVLLLISCVTSDSVLTTLCLNFLICKMGVRCSLHGGVVRVQLLCAELSKQC